jgi:exopolyphosphatase/guanosine-5'-triphosphate,3'-diphosphate pyrophosphatase
MRAMARLSECDRDLGLNPACSAARKRRSPARTACSAPFPTRGVVGDLGGGSLELIDVADGRCTHGISMPLGTLRLPARAGQREFTQK